MLFSVIIPIYNAEKTLRRCLDSLLPQAEGKAELLLVNDGSSDESEKICLEYEKAWPEVRYIHKNNGGVSSARNAGLAAATGEYVTFVDSDDYVSPDYFAVLSECRDVDFLFFSAETEQNGHRTDRIDGAYLADAADYYHFVQAFVQMRNGSPWNKRFRLSIIRDRKICFPQELHLGEDFVFCLRYLLVAKTFAVCENVLYHQDESNGNSLTKKYNANFTDQTLRIYTLAQEAISSSDFPPPQKESLLQWLYYIRSRTAFACAMEYFKTDDTRFRTLRPKIKSVLSAFSSGIDLVEPVDLRHRVMNLCIKRQWAYPVYCIAGKRYRQKRASS